MDNVSSRLFSSPYGSGFVPSQDAEDSAGKGKNAAREPSHSPAEKTAGGPSSFKASQSTLSQLTALGIHPPQRQGRAASAGGVNLAEVISDTKAYIAELEKRATTIEGVEHFNQPTDDIISRNRKAAHGNDRLMAESIAMINASRPAGAPPIHFALDAYNVFLHLKHLQSAMREDGSAPEPKTLRFVFKPNEEDYDHTVMCECEVHRDHILISGIDSHALNSKTQRTADLLTETAAQFPDMKTKMGVCFTGAQKGWGCLHFALANAEMVPSVGLAALKKKIIESDKPCLLVEDKTADVLPMEVFPYVQGWAQADELLKKCGLEKTPAREMLRANRENHLVTKTNDEGEQKTFINSLPSYRLATLRKLLAHLEAQQKADPAGAAFAKTLAETVVRPDQSWRRPLAGALADLQWTPDKEVPKLLDELQAKSAAMGEPDGTDYRIRKTKEFLNVFPALESSRLRSVPRQMMRKLEQDENIPDEKKLELLQHALSVFRENAGKIREAEAVELRDLKLLLVQYGDLSALF